MSAVKKKLLEAKWFGLVIGVLVFALFMVFRSLSLFEFLDQVVLDANFNLRSVFGSSALQVGVTQQDRNAKVSPDIVIVGVDVRSLERFGKWPWPRSRHADFLNTLSRIKNQNDREAAVLLDFFFVEKSTQAEQDALLVDAIGRNGRVVLETVLDKVEADPSTIAEQYDRQRVLEERQVPIRSITGDTDTMDPYFRVQAPLKPIARAGAGYGHPNFLPDSDKTFRRQELVAKFSELVEIFDESQLDPAWAPQAGSNERVAWQDREGIEHTVKFPLGSDGLTRLRQELRDRSPVVVEDSDGDGTPDKEYRVLKRYRDHYLPSLTLTLALRYFNKTVDDIEVVVGDHIRIPAPQRFNPETGAWEPYRIETRPAEYDDAGVLVRDATWRDVPVLDIPIDENCAMLINFMGPPSGDAGGSYQTFPVRSYAGYAARATGADEQSWPATLSLANKIVLAGIFAQGTASDDKKTPFGIMYGIEVHANALNTILMDNFIRPVAPWLNALVLAVACLFIAFLTSRLKTPFALVVTLVSAMLFYLGATILFEFQSVLIDFAIPILGMFATLVAVIAYRVMTEEREKHRIHDMFGKYVSKSVVDIMVAQGQQPELGGIDKELTVLFSDIRGFTTLSESMTPQELVNHLNTYLTAMTDLIMEYQGTLDKYVGDEIMCFWGAPVPQADHALLACKCALKQMEKLAELNASWPPERRIDIGIGVNSGIMTVGNMGSIGRMNYTLMGDNVNLGARLEGTNKQYYTHIIISEYTYALVKDKVIVRELDNIRVKGKNKPVVIYELVDVLED